MLENDGKVRIVWGDATHPGVQQRTQEVVSAYLSGLDNLVITLGVIGEIETVERLDIGKMRDAMEINFIAPVQLVHHPAQHMPLPGAIYRSTSTYREHTSHIDPAIPTLLASKQQACCDSFIGSRSRSNLDRLGLVLH